MENSENKPKMDSMPHNPKKSNGRAYTVNIDELKETSEDLTPEQNAYVRAHYSRDVDYQIAAGSIAKEDRDLTIKTFCDGLFRMPDETINAVIQDEKDYRAKSEEERKKVDATMIGGYSCVKKMMDREMASREKAYARREKFDKLKKAVKTKIDNSTLLKNLKARMGR